MANTDRKARKRAGIPFTKTSKVLTPPEERSVPEVYDRNGRKSGISFLHPSKRALARREKQNEARTI